MSATRLQALDAPPTWVRSHERDAAVRRPLVRLAAFGALGVYGALRWATLLRPQPTARLLGLLAATVLLTAAIPRLWPRSRALAVGVALVACVAIFPLAGVPLRWVVHMRIARTASGIDQGLSALPRVLVPYNGVDEWVRMVIVLGAGILLLCAGLLLGFAGRSPNQLRIAAAAVPLIALAVVPSTLAHPRLAYVHGLILFALLALLLFAEQVARSDLLGALAICAVGGAAALGVAPALEQHHPWIDYQALAGAFSPSQVDAFDWTQNYAALRWPRGGREILDVAAARGGYWKAENLDLFNGRGWASSPVSTGADLPAPDPQQQSRFTQTLKVTIRSLETPDVIAAGFAERPENAPGVVLRGTSAGTWTSGSQLGPGDSYQVTVYTPQPSPSELASAGDSYAGRALQPYLSLTLPQHANTPVEVIFPPYRSAVSPIALGASPDSGPQAAIDGSPYAQSYALARQLEGSSDSAYGFVASVERYLSRGYRYNETPPPRRYPLSSFLFRDREGYCQQFAGAMALLLRMGGVPARVAVGFTTGTYDKSAHSWKVTDLDAHAWVEAWFPHYGWVSFDPTPGSDPARGGRIPPPPTQRRSAAHKRSPTRAQPRHRLSAPLPAAGGPRRPPSGGASSAPGIIAAVVLLALAGLAALLLRPRAISSEMLLSELERALKRSGRPAPPGLTLAGLEQRFRHDQGATGYVRAVRMTRFAGALRVPTVAQRRALRSQLAAGLGPMGVLRAWWALPPRRWQRPHHAGP